MINFRKLLKDTIRGQMLDFDVPALPACAFDDDGEAVNSDEELRLFFELLDELVVESGMSNPMVLREIEKLRADYDPRKIIVVT